jgi:transcriptional regulator GlxA family with amidase domain
VSHRYRTETVLLLTEGFPLFAMAGVLEVYRHANRFARADYVTRVSTVEGVAVRASNGVLIQPDGDIADEARPDNVMVVAGFDAESLDDSRLLTPLRQLAQRGVLLGGISNGAFVLARAGLLDGYRCTVHWEDFASFRELFPRTIPVFERFVCDRDRVTCSGGSSTVDLVLDLITREQGESVVRRIAEQLMVEAFRDTEMVRARYHSLPGQTLSSATTRAVAYLESCTDAHPDNQALAQVAGVSPRQLTRLFKTELGSSPHRFSLQLRLRRARSMLFHTRLGIAEIAAATGFSSHSHLTRRYRAAYGVCPALSRRAYRARPPTVSEDEFG